MYTCSLVARQNKTMNWEIVKKDFEFDGSLIDIYISETTLNDWLKIINYLKNSPEYRIELSVDYLYNNSKEITLEDNIKELINERDNYNSCLKIYREKIQINNHFYAIDEIEFDIDPREINNQQSLNIILDFINNLGKITKKEIFLTPENYKEKPIIKYVPYMDYFIYLKANK